MALGRDGMFSLGIFPSINHDFVSVVDDRFCATNKSKILNRSSFGSRSRGELPAGYGDFPRVTETQSCSDIYCIFKLNIEDGDERRARRWTFYEASPIPSSSPDVHLRRESSCIPS
jgi:hypothetical protein